MKIISRIIVANFILMSCVMCSAGSDNQTQIISGPISISESNTNISLAQGDQYQLEVYDIHGNNITTSANWTSDNPNIASVINGTVTIESNQGTANVYAQYNGESSNQITFSSGRVMFATESLYDGNLLAAAKSQESSITDGIAAANYLCNIDNNKPQFGTFKALIKSTDQQDNLNIVIDTSKTVNYINKDGSLIGTSQLNSGNPYILFNGDFVDNNHRSESTTIFNWTGFNNNACDNWANSGSTGDIGYDNNSNNWYTNTNINPQINGIWSYYQTTCSTKQALICVQQPGK